MSAPLISIDVEHRQRPHSAGEPLNGEFQIDAVDAAELRAVELSVLWYTEGKGDEDLGVHHFERWTDEDAAGQPLIELRKFAVSLPNSPLSYEGVLVKLRWCVRAARISEEWQGVLCRAAVSLGKHTGCATGGTA